MVAAALSMVLASALAAVPTASGGRLVAPTRIAPHRPAIARMRMASDDGDALEQQQKQLRAQEMELEAERAALEAAKLELEAERLKLRQRTPPPAPEAAPEAVPAPALAAPLPPPLLSRLGVGAQDRALTRFLREVDTLCGGQRGADALADSLREAWASASDAQQRQISTLRAQLERAERLAEEGGGAGKGGAEEGGWLGKMEAALTAKAGVSAEQERMRESLVNVGTLWTAANDAKKAEFPPLIFRFLQRPSEKELGLAPVDGSEVVVLEGEGAFDLPFRRERLRVLESHADASTVEYRLFGEALAAQAGDGGVCQTAGVDFSLEQAAVAAASLIESLDREFDVEAPVSDLEAVVEARK